jgi:hypothetical protein
MVYCPSCGLSRQNALNTFPPAPPPLSKRLKKWWAHQKWQKKIKLFPRMWFNYLRNEYFA